MAYEDLNTKFTDGKTSTYEYFSVSPNLSADLYPTINGIDSVKQGLERLLTTPKGTDPFNREYGSSLYNLLFENVTSISTIRMFLYMDILTWEPRVDIRPQDIEIIQLDNNTYKVSCNFILKEYNISANLTTTITKE